MPDPQDAIKKWLSERLEEKGYRAHAELASLLHVHADAVRRMKNRDGTKESRRIEAHHIPIMADYFGQWPPGYNMSETEEPSRELPAKEVQIDSGGGNVTVIDKSINVIGDSANICSGEPSADLMGKINVAIGEAFQEMGNTISLEDLGRIALQYHTGILTACESEDEYPYAIEIMKLRLKRRLVKL